MGKPKNALEVFKLLDQSNCRQCGKKTCLAFAGAVFTGQKNLSDCPRLDEKTRHRFAGDDSPETGQPQDGERRMHELIDAVTALDLNAAAERVGARFSRNRLTLKMMGKDVSIDQNGQFFTDIHVNPWMAVPFLCHILNGRGVASSGKWVSFRELTGGREWYPLFRKRCETAIKRLADHYPGLFEDIVDIFNGRQVDEQFESDISVVLDPLPNVPVMMCYWFAEDGMASSFNFFFDETVNQNLDIEAAFTLGTGLAAMFEKLTVRHGILSGTG
ncbi:MAG: Fe-S cluster protein [Deltaproteobacteria bacterium]|nr:MAG: Fe-S cluster protein [Deltaproteobacteria bacterium]